MDSALQHIQRLINNSKGENLDVKKVEVIPRPHLNIEEIIDSVNQQTRASPVKLGKNEEDNAINEEEKVLEEKVLEEVVPNPNSDEEIAVRLARELIDDPPSELNNAEIVIRPRDNYRENYASANETPIRRRFREGEFEEWLSWLHTHGFSHWGEKDWLFLMNEFYQIKANNKICECGRTSSELGFVH